MRKLLFALVAWAVLCSTVWGGPLRNFIENRRAARSGYAASSPSVVQPAVVVDASFEANTDDALDEVNANRKAAGLRPFIKDEGLTRAAAACIAYRVRNLIHGHTGNDFMFVPEGSTAKAAGSDAGYHNAGDGWGTCCTFDAYTYAGAACAVGPDGKRFMHIFVR